MNKRIKCLRKNLGMSMEKFGNELGISKSAISGFESGITNPSEQTIKLICKTFNVDYFWLTEGVGEMFTNFPETIIDEVVDEFNLDETDKIILMAYLELSDEKRAAVKAFLLSIAENAKKKGE